MANTDADTSQEQKSLSGLDFKAGLFLFFIVVMGGYFEKSLNCDLQRFMSNSIIGKHILAILTAFFTIVLTGYGDDDDNPPSLWDYFKTTMLIYVIYIFSTKSKAIFVFPMLIILAIDQILNVYTTQLQKRNKKASKQQVDTNNESITTIDSVRSLLSYSIISLIGVGCISYYIRQRMEFGQNFSTQKFFLGTFHCEGA